MSLIGDYIARRRRTLRLTQTEVSERLSQYGVNRTSSTVAGWETDKQDPPVDILPALAKALEEPSVVQLYVAAGLFTSLPIERVAALFDSLDVSDQMVVADLVDSLVRRSKNHR